MIKENKICENIIRLNYYCDKCNNGKMIFKKINFKTYKFIHHCELCDNEEELNESYPTIK